MRRCTTPYVSLAYSVRKIIDTFHSEQLSTVRYVHKCLPELLCVFYRMCLTTLRLIWIVNMALHCSFIQRTDLDY